MIPLYDMSRIDKSIQTERRLAVTRGRERQMKLLDVK